MENKLYVFTFDKAFKGKFCKYLSCIVLYNFFVNDNLLNLRDQAKIE